MIFNLDLDNVVYDWAPVYTKYLAVNTGVGPYTVTPKTYRVYEEWGVTGEKFMDVLEDYAYEIFTEGEPLPGAIPTIFNLVRAKHEVRIVTHKRWVDRPRLTALGMKGAIDWCSRYGLLPHVNMVFTGGDKTTFAADVIIDDKTDLSWKQPGAVNWLFGRSWNEDAVGVVRLADWTEVNDALVSIGAL